MLTVILLVLFILLFPPLEVSESMVTFLYNNEVARTESDEGENEEVEESPVEDLFTDDGSEIDVSQSPSSEAEQLIDEIYQ